MTKPEEFPNDDAAELNAEEMQKFAEELLHDFQTRDFTELTPEQAKMLASMPSKLRMILQQIERVKEAKKPENRSNNPQLREKQDKENNQKLEKLAQEIFITSCASRKTIDESLAFHQKNNLGVKGLNEFGDNGLNPLTAALAGGKSPEEMKKLLGKEGVDINFKSPNGSNAAHFAVMFGVNSEMMGLLIEHGVDINAKNSFGLTPLDMAVLKGDEKMAKFLGEKGAKLGMVSVKSGREEEEEKDQQRARKKENKKSPDNSDAKEKSDLERQKIEQEKSEREAVRLRSQEQQIRIGMELFEEARAKIAKVRDLKNEAEKKFEAEESVKKLSEKNALVEKNIISEKNSTPSTKVKILEAESLPEKSRQNQQSREKEMLRQMGFDPEKFDINQSLFRAVSSGHSTIAQFLIQLGANVDYKENNISVFEAAVVMGNLSLIGVLATRIEPETRKKVLASAPEATREAIQKLPEVEKLQLKEIAKEEKSQVVAKILQVNERPQQQEPQPLVKEREEKSQEKNRVIPAAENPKLELPKEVKTEKKEEGSKASIDISSNKTDVMPRAESSFDKLRMTSDKKEEGPKTETKILQSKEVGDLPQKREVRAPSPIPKPSEIRNLGNNFSKDRPRTAPGG